MLNELLNKLYYPIINDFPLTQIFWHEMKLTGRLAIVVHQSIRTVSIVSMLANFNCIAQVELRKLCSSSNFRRPSGYIDEHDAKTQESGVLAALFPPAARRFAAHPGATGALCPLHRCVASYQE
jgi:hypothetical protein